MGICGWIATIVIVAGIWVVWNFLKEISGLLVNIFFACAGFICVWLLGIPQAVVHWTGFNEIFVYIVFGIVNFILVVGIYANIKGEV